MSVGTIILIILIILLLGGFSGACDGMFGQSWRSHAESCVD